MMKNLLLLITINLLVLFSSSLYGQSPWQTISSNEIKYKNISVTQSAIKSPFLYLTGGEEILLNAADGIFHESRDIQFDSERIYGTTDKFILYTPFAGFNTFNPQTTMDIRHKLHDGLAIRTSSMNAKGMGLFLAGGGPTNDADWGGIIAGASHDLETFTARSNTASGIILKDGEIYFKAQEGLVSGQNYTGFQFQDAMTIKANGRVGLGTSTPDYKLDVMSDAAIRATLHFRNPAFDIGAHVGFNTGGDFDHFAFKVESAAGYYTFQTNNAGSLGEVMRLTNDGLLGIGTDAPEYKLDVAGTIRACEVKVNLKGGWCDYVFDEDYNLLSLSQVESHIKSNGHLHNTPSAAQVEADGLLDLESATVNQQEKIEEIFLHLIELEKKVKRLEEENTALKSEIKNK